MPKVLVIDDENTILENIKFVLELEDYDVLTAPSGEEGINLFKKNIKNVDVVISDMKMPRLSGMDVLREIKRLMPQMGVIVLTGHGDMENAILAMKEGAFEYLKKPVNADDLVIAIKNATEKKNLLLQNAKMQQELLEHNNFLQGLHDSAQRILINLIPKKFPDTKGFNFTVKYKSSDAVGGDMYDVCDTGDYLFFYVFDVASHGILASVITVILKSFIQNVEYNYAQLNNKKSLSDIIKDLNLDLQASTAQNVFATLFIGFLEKKTQKLFYISAGHIPQYVFNENEVITMSSTGAILGVFEDAVYTCNELQLKPGDKILLFTDGLTEASLNDELFGEDNLLSILNNHKNEPIANIVNYIYDEIEAYTKGSFQDDLTILGIELVD